MPWMLSAVFALFVTYSFEPQAGFTHSLQIELLGHIEQLMRLISAQRNRLRTFATRFLSTRQMC
jgi:hypothetical protein